MIVESFLSHLESGPGVAAICQSFYPKVLPQVYTDPAITYGVDQDSDDQLLGDSGSLSEAIFDVDCWSVSYLTAHQLADAVEALLVGHTGALGSASPSLYADHIRKERRFDLFEADTKLYRVSLQFLVAYY